MGVSHAYKGFSHTPADANSQQSCKEGKAEKVSSPRPRLKTLRLREVTRPTRGHVILAWQCSGWKPDKRQEKVDGIVRRRRLSSIGVIPIHPELTQYAQLKLIHSLLRDIVLTLYMCHLTDLHKNPGRYAL